MKEASQKIIAWFKSLTRVKKIFVTAVVAVIIFFVGQMFFGNNVDGTYEASQNGTKMTLVIHGESAYMKNPSMSESDEDLVGVVKRSGQTLTISFKDPDDSSEAGELDLERDGSNLKLVGYGHNGHHYSDSAGRAIFYRQ